MLNISTVAAQPKFSPSWVVLVSEELIVAEVDDPDVSEEELEYPYDSVLEEDLPAVSEREVELPDVSE